MKYNNSEDNLIWVEFKNLKVNDYIFYKNKPDMCYRIKQIEFVKMNNNSMDFVNSWVHIDVCGIVNVKILPKKFANKKRICYADKGNIIETKITSFLFKVFRERIL